MRNVLLLLSLVFSSVCSYSQSMSMTLAVPPNGVLIKPQLWNLSLTNTASLSKQVEIELILTDVSTGEVALTGTTSPVTVSNGTKQVTNTDLIIQYDYPSSLIGDHDPNGYLTIGNFNACYTLYDVSSPHENPVLEECTGVIVEPLSPPLLNMPCDSCYAESTAPLFSWLPPTPLNLFSNLTYEMRLVEIAPGQASSEAIQMNAPVLLQDGNVNPFLNYPASGTLLDTSKTYAWQIIAKNNNIYAAQSEIWTFRLFSLPLPDTAEIRAIDYVVYKSGDNSKGVYVIANDTISVKYRSQMIDTATIEFRDENDQVIYSQEETLSEGDNFFVVPLPGSFKRNNIYSFRLLYSKAATAKMYFTQL